MTDAARWGIALPGHAFTELLRGFALIIFFDFHHVHKFCFLQPSSSQHIHQDCLNRRRCHGTHKMESLSDTVWDVVICGTGLQQSLLAL